jgi:hypothetical protein
LLPALAIAAYLVISTHGGKTGEDRIPYSTFLQQLDSGRVARVTIHETDLRFALVAPDA